MSRRKKNRKQEPPVQPINNRAGTLGTLGGLALAAFFISWWITNRVNESQAPAVAETTLAVGIPAVVETPAPKPAPVEKPEPVNFRPLEGKWVRPDGGYVLEIRSIDPSGKMNAAYLNPRSINISSAQASREGESLRVSIELRDTNYPGSLYHLTYDPGTDSLAGTYFQATEQQQFEVEFKRMK